MSRISRRSFLAGAGGLAVGAGAFGAGFGGSVWALVPESRADRFPAEWARRYRRTFPEAAQRGEVFVTRAGPPMVRL